MVKELNQRWELVLDIKTKARHLCLHEKVAEQKEINHNVVEGIQDSAAQIVVFTSPNGDLTPYIVLRVVGKIIIQNSGL